MRAAAASAGLLLLVAGPLAAQARRDPGPVVERYHVPLLRQQPTPGASFLASAVLPGAGQYLLGEERWVPYTALEVWSWITYLDRRGDAGALERRYRDLAWGVARRVSSGIRRDTTFEYYEALAQWDASGAFDADPRQPGVQPEVDLSTYNGQVWRLARSLYIPGGGNFPPGTVEYQRALAHYLQNAIAPEFAWAWGASRLEQQAYADLISESDEAFRMATQLLGLIIANHVVSAVDALVTARIRSVAGATLRIRPGSRLEADGQGIRPTYSIQLRW